MWSSLRSPCTNSSAFILPISFSFRSTARTQYPSSFNRFTKWPPINPPAPHTSAFFCLLIDPLTFHLSDCNYSPVYQFRHEIGRASCREGVLVWVGCG